ncbi:putative xyloglucan endotransglucosylase/hydrolase protein 10 [Varanus komodoensis]|nr:putative xyloglucan endotransglucosylase/hydrolase protein 10 [Varanus komodoensis]
MSRWSGLGRFAEAVCLEREIKGELPRSSRGGSSPFLEATAFYTSCNCGAIIKGMELHGERTLLQSQLTKADWKVDSIKITNYPARKAGNFWVLSTAIIAKYNIHYQEAFGDLHLVGFGLLVVKFTEKCYFGHVPLAFLTGRAGFRNTAMEDFMGNQTPAMPCRGLSTIQPQIHMWNPAFFVHKKVQAWCIHSQLLQSCFLHCWVVLNNWMHTKPQRKGEAGPRSRKIMPSLSGGHASSWGSTGGKGSYPWEPVAKHPDVESC